MGCVIALHELSVATSIFEAVLEVASKHSAKKVLEVNIDVGELTLLNPDQLALAFEVLSKGTVVEGAKININVIKARARCNKCGEEWNLNLSYMTPTMSHVMAMTCPACDLKAFFRGVCPKCGESDFDFISGSELVIKSIRIET